VILEHKALIARDDLMKILEKKEFEVLITMGAGDIDAFVEPIKQFLIDKYGN
jgi:UDP-N-acetylmuramate--alanine ligase